MERFDRGLCRALGGLLAACVLLQGIPVAIADPGTSTVTSEPGTDLPDTAWNVVRAGPEDYRARVASLEPGDWLQLAPGDYPWALRLHGVRGTPEQPIVISGPVGGEPAILRGRRGENTISLVDAEHVVIRHLTLDGGGEPVAGVVAEARGDGVHHVTLEHLTIRHYDHSQGNAGITTRAPARDWVIRHNEIHDVGTGMYLGQPDGTSPFVAGVIEHNHVHRTLGYNIQIKHQTDRDGIPGMPAEPRETRIRYNLLSKAERASDGGRARPNLLVGHFPPAGPGSQDRYRIAGNLFYQNPHERLFQGEGNIELHDNLFLNDTGDAVLVRPHNHRPREIRIVNNTILATGFGIRVDASGRAYDQEASGNAVFAGDPLQLSGRIAGGENFIAARADAARYLAAPDAGQDALDLYPREGALHERSAGVSSAPAAGADRDYNGRLREQAVWGAYAGPPGPNPGRADGVGPRVPGCAPCR
nr:hypothetical protein [Thioalkalivibrio sp. AKL8]